MNIKVPSHTLLKQEGLEEVMAKYKGENAMTFTFQSNAYQYDRTIILNLLEETQTPCTGDGKYMLFLLKSKLLFTHYMTL